MLDNIEQFRFQCEVRELLRWGVSKPRGTVGGYLALVESKRGKLKRDQLEAAYVEQWSLGNRGERGEWRESNDVNI